MNWLSFAVGFAVCYVITAWFLVICDGKGGIELFDGWAINILCAPVYIVAPITRRIFKLIQRHKRSKKQH